ncbi:PREDICTED: MARVEL domain-containing protein 3 isoform X2 [Ceratotherium simum simum]|uniref:MARVEL domain-containing protein 3 isoform X2 n=1 Tax=Ceratotherium simum simum TaxID=73337 RepID=A0ABM0HQI1_CERSS|nr:PREDICTED: MARVEL domain-containing protein 3 isoform X2 [Ceratotherium simum simum]
MEDTSGTREPRARPREREPERRPRPDRDRHSERPRDRAGDRRRERNEGGRRDGDRDRGRDRDPRQDGSRLGDHRAGEHRVREKSRQSRTPDRPRRPTWDAAPPPWPAPWETPEPPPQRKEALGRRTPESEFTSERYLPPNPNPGREEVEYYQSEAAGLLECHKCRYLCTGRACCQMLEVLLNLLILACSSVSYGSTGGYTGITSLGGIYYYQYGGAYSGFAGADGETAQQLDVQFYQLKLPTVTVAMAYSGALMAFCCLLVAMGVLRVPWHCPLLLVVEGLLDVLIAGAYVPALYFYFHYLSAAYASPVCKERETLYHSKGYSGFSCSFHGGDIGAGIFAALGIGVFALGAVLAFRGYRKVRKLKENPAEMLQF